VDELRSGLELATEAELQAMTEILFRPRFNPLDYLYTPAPLAVQGGDRTHWLDQLDRRVRFLAADGFTVLQGQSHQLSYRQILRQICRHLKISYEETWSTDDLEAELFLELLEQTWQRLSQREQRQLQRQVKDSLIATEQFQHLSPHLQQDPLGILLKGSSALAVSAVVRPWLLRQVAQQFALHFARYQVAQQTLKGALSLGAQVQGRAALQVASRGMALNAARYGAMRGIFAFLGPAMWGWFLADLGWRAIASNYTRVIPVVFTLAQIRLTRGSQCWETA
jgi:uncharacterized protein YaaW (UPF0174 family)